MCALPITAPLLLRTRRAPVVPVPAAFAIQLARGAARLCVRAQWREPAAAVAECGACGGLLALGRVSASAADRDGVGGAGEAGVGGGAGEDVVGEEYE